LKRVPVGPKEFSGDRMTTEADAVQVRASPGVDLFLDGPGGFLRNGVYIVCRREGEAGAFAGGPGHDRIGGRPWSCGPKARNIGVHGSPCPWRKTARTDRITRPGGMTLLSADSFLS